MTSQESSTDVNPVWQSMTGSIIQNQTNRKALQAKRDALSQQVSELRRNLSRAEDSTVEYTTLRQKVADLTNNYQLYTQKRDEAQMADSMNENRLLNVAIQQNPTYSAMPFRPKPVVDSILGGLTAIFLASFLVFLAEMGRETIANSYELDKYARYPVLATVPLDKDRKRKKERLPDFGPVLIGLTAHAEPQKMQRASLVRYR